MTIFSFIAGTRIKNTRRRKNQVSSWIADTLEPRLLLTAVTMADEEQLLLELINRARANPTAEAARYGIGLNDNLPAGTISTTPKQPLAANQLLINASVAHSQDMMARNFFAHTNPSGITPGGRATAAGYDWLTIAENIAYAGYFGSPDVAAQTQLSHELLFESSGHRTNILKEDVEEIGLGIRSGAYALAGSNATIVTEKFGRRGLNPIITGVVYSDVNDSNFYDIGEAIRSGTVTATRLSDNQVFSEEIGVSGGYGIIVPAGTYNVVAEFSVNGATATLTRQITVQTINVKVDFDASTVDSLAVSLTTSTALLNESGTSSVLPVTVTRTGSVALPLTVNLVSSDTTEMTVAATVVIPAGQASAQFSVSGVADGIIDGLQTARVTATATGASAANLALRVADRTTAGFAASLVTSTVTRPVFNWTAIANAASYEILVTNPVATPSTVISVAGIASTSYASLIDLPIGNYNVYVRGMTSAGLRSVWSSGAVWRVRPATTVLNNGSRESSGSFQIRWNAVPGAAAYDVWVDRLTSNTRQYLRNQNVVGTSLDVTGFDIGRYRIFVRSRTLTGVLTGWSPGAIMDVRIPAAGLAVSGSQLTTIPTLNWNAIPGAVGYEVRVDNRTTNSTMFINDTSVTGTSRALASLTPGAYRAWVRARDITGAVYPYGVPLDFSFNSAPRFSMAITNPMPSQPLLTWTPVSGATRYELIIANAAMTPLITESNLTGTQYQPGSSLAAGTYRAWLRAFDANGNQTTRSSIILFTVAGADLIPDDSSEGSVVDTAFASFDLLISGHSTAGRQQQSPHADAFDVVVNHSAETRAGDEREEPAAPAVTPAGSVIAGVSGSSQEAQEQLRWDVRVLDHATEELVEVLPASVSAKLMLSTKWRKST